MAQLLKQLAPWPYVDRSPTVIGQGLSLTYLGAVSRLTLYGYRQQYADLLDELLEKDPHAYGIMAKRVQTISGGKLEIEPPDLDNDADRKLAKDIAADTKRRVLSIPGLKGAIARLAWADYYGVTCAEKSWARDEDGWCIAALSFVHTRRLAYPLADDWRLRIWDQGPVTPMWGQSPTNQTFGIAVDDYPGKFVTHTANLRGDYPTREGLGREISTWIVLKLIASRGASNYLERFARPLPEGIYNTTESGPGAMPRRAEPEDLDDAKLGLAQMATGSSSWWLHSDSIKLNLLTPDGTGTGKITFADWIAVCDSQMSKAVLGSTLTTEVGVAGSRAVAETQKKSGEDRLFQFSADCLAETIKRDIVNWLVRLNFPTAPARCYPDVALRTGEEPDPMSVLDKAVKAASIGMPVDADAIATEIGLALIPAELGERRRCYPVKPTDFSPPPEVIGLPKAEPVPEPVDTSSDDVVDQDNADDESDDEPLKQAAE